jgi:histidinol phosphatase-like enzyme
MKLKNKTLTNETKLLFLDFDGVLNSYEEGGYKTHTPEEYGPSITICNKIIKLCKETGAKIIISSNWRKFKPDGW